MPRTVPRISRQAGDAARLLGAQIAVGRHERQWTLTELAERAGVSAPTARKVERGDPTVALGIAFEMAVLTGVALFTPDRAELSTMTQRAKDHLSLLPERVRAPSADVHDDF